MQIVSIILSAFVFHAGSVLFILPLMFLQFQFIYSFHTGYYKCANVISTIN